jgi:hypothetical protein
MKSLFKNPLLLVVMGILIAASVSAVLLTAFNVVEVEADVEQSVLVDGKQYDESISESLDLVAGDIVCLPHEIENRATIDIPLQLESTDEEGIEITYRMADAINLQLTEDDFRYETGTTFDAFNVSFTQDSEHIIVTVTEEDPIKYPWAMVFVSNADDEYKYRAGYNPIKDDTGLETFYQEYPWGPFTQESFEDAGFDGSVNRTNESITIKIPLEELEEGDRLSMNVQAAGDGSRGQHKFPTSFNWNNPSNDAPIVGTFNELNNPFSVDAESTMNFEICYDFHWALAPAVYDLETEVQPNLAE